MQKLIKVADLDKDLDFLNEHLTTLLWVLRFLVRTHYRLEGTEEADPPRHTGSKTMLGSLGLEVAAGMKMRVREKERERERERLHV